MEVSPPRSRTIQISLVLGIAIYVASFFLPAVNDAGSGSLRGTTMPGWICAEIALVSWKEIIFLSGLINPLILIYVVLRGTNRLNRVQTYTVVAILACIAVTWIELVRRRFHMEVGHVMWIAGLLLIMAPELARWKVSLQLEE